MKRPKKSILTVILLPVSVLISQAAISTNYSIQAQVIEGAGLHSIGGPYAIQSSVRDLGSQTSAENPTTIIRTGYTGQIYSISNLSITASVNPVSEESTTQLSAVAQLDDSTEIHPESAEVGWAINSGPIQSISTSGLAATAKVLATEIAMASGSYNGITGNTTVTVLDSLPDNFGSYGGDGLDDNWQYTYFGLPPNENASPNANPDGDTDSNEMEFLTGFDPTDPTSWFQVVIKGKSGNTATLLINKVIPGRTYTINRGTDLQVFPDTITVLNPDIEERDKIIQDSGAIDQKVFYQVDVERP